jgi:hypothetical protein
VASQPWNDYQMEGVMMGGGKEWVHGGGIEDGEAPNSENGEIRIYNRQDIGLTWECQIFTW